LREVPQTEKFVGVFCDFWCGNGGPNPPRALWDSSIFSVIFVALVSLCSSIFVLGRDLKFPWIDQTLGDDFLGIAHLLHLDYLDSISWQLDLAWVINQEVLCPPVVLFLQREFSVLRCSSSGDVFQLQRYQSRCESTKLACLSSACSDRLTHCCRTQSTRGSNGHSWVLHLLSKSAHIACASSRLPVVASPYMLVVSLV